MASLMKYGGKRVPCMTSHSGQLSIAKYGCLRLLFPIGTNLSPSRSLRTPVAERKASLENPAHAFSKIADRYFKVYLRSLSRPEEFWSEQANHLVWDKQGDKVLDDSLSPFTKWFPDWHLSVCYNALDRHCDDGNGDKVALYHESPVTESRTSVTYRQLLDEVRFLAGYLSSLGIQKGDRVVIYMPMIPQAVTAMLACSRIGAIHSVVFGGFAAKELATRVSHAKAVAVICGSHGIERGKKVDYKKIVDDAIEKSSNKPKHVVVYQRAGSSRTEWTKGRDHDWQEAVAKGKSVDCVPVGAMDPLYILYTSGTTGTPKAVIRPAGGYAVALRFSMYNVYGMEPGDVWWAASDFGWVVGHSYICYAPLLCGNPSIIYEGKVTDTPDSGSFFRLVERYGVKGMFTTPTAMRSLMQADPESKFGRAHNVSSLKYVFIAGEHCDQGTKKWTTQAFGAPTLDNWWQTESGWPMTSTSVGLGASLDPPKDSSGHAVPGSDSKTGSGWKSKCNQLFSVRVLDEDSGKPKPPGEVGRIAVKLPLPPGYFSGLWENDEGFKKTYFTKYPGYYDTMDAGSVDADGYVSILSRMDDIINVSGVRISTSAIEEVILRHSSVAECAVIGVKDKLKGHIPLGLVVLKSGAKDDEEGFTRTVIKMVRDDVGPIASFKTACVVPQLPKTRSGKIARPSLVALAENRPVKIPVTIEDPDVYPAVQEAMRKIGYAEQDFKSA